MLTYLLSNNYINEIISHDFDFENEEVISEAALRTFETDTGHGVHALESSR